MRSSLTKHSLIAVALVAVMASSSFAVVLHDQIEMEDAWQQGFLNTVAGSGFMGVTVYGMSDVTESDSETVIGGGGSVGVDLKNLNFIPLGLLFSFDSDAFSQGGADLATRSNGFGLGLFWTGWQNFIIGLETTMRLLDRRDTPDDFEAFVATFNLRYWP